MNMNTEFERVKQNIDIYIEEKQSETELSETEFEINNPDLDKYYLFFYADNGSREDCSVYYSTLVIAKNKNDAIDKFLKCCNIDIDEYNRLYDCERFDPIV